LVQRDAGSLRLVRGRAARRDAHTLVDAAAAAGAAAHGDWGEGVPSMIATFASTVGILAVMVFVISVVAFAVYALVRPFTHLHYHHPSEKLWRPLD
jgi:hypothetical protein